MTQIWRRANETVAIGDDVTVKVLEVGQSFVRLGISCPRNEPAYQEVELTLAGGADYNASELELVGASRYCS